MDFLLDNIGFKNFFFIVGLCPFLGDDFCNILRVNCHGVCNITFRWFNKIVYTETDIHTHTHTYMYICMHVYYIRVCVWMDG